MRRLAWMIFAGATFAVSLPAHARPVAPELVCDRYPNAPACLAGQLVACQTCHVQAGTTKLNGYGEDVRAVLLESASAPFSDADFDLYLDGALASVEEVDSDDDGFSNLDELLQGSYPGLASSVPTVPSCPDDPSQYPYEFCKIDDDFRYQRVAIDFCGQRPTFEELEAFRALDEGGRWDALHAKLDACLDTEFWTGPNGQLAELAHRKIRPVTGLQNFADFVPDYSLFVYANTGDRDVRDVLLAQYVVESAFDGERTIYTPVETLPSQPLEPGRRAGLLTSAWMLFYNTMFTAIPRSTAAQAYRAYLNFDIALQEGLTYDTPEPIDYDGAGVTGEGCIGCHRTIEALTGPFTRYNGLQGPNYQYNPSRMALFGLPEVPESGVVLGQPVADLLEWAEVAANSDEFYRAVTADYWKLLVGRAPSPEDPAMFEEYTILWQSLRDDSAHMVNRMLHELIDTEAYGAP